MKIYIEDAAANELVINGVPCRKLGELKNNQEKTFEIGTEGGKVFAIADRLSKDYCNEYYQLPEGQEDVFLSGENKFNPASGNAFQFDYNEAADVLQNRKKNTKKGVLILIAAILVGGIVGCAISVNLFSAPKAEPKTFTDEGMRITLTDEFREAEAGNYTVCYESSRFAVFALKEEFSLLQGSEQYTTAQYADLVLQNNALSATTFDRDGLVGFEYDFTNPETKDTFRYFSFVYKTEDAFWLVQFATPAATAETYRTSVTEWAKTVSFE